MNQACATITEEFDKKSLLSESEEVFIAKTGIHIDYKNYEEVSEQFVKRIEELKEKIREKLKISINPIIFLGYLYYNKKLSYRLISEKLLGDYGIDYPFTTLRKNLTEYCLFNGRAKTDSTPEKQGIKGSHRNQINEKAEEINSLVNEILKLTNWKINFKMQEYEKRIGNTEKAKYILTSFGIIKKDEFELYITKCFYTHNHSLDVIAKAIEGIANDIILKESLKIDNLRISKEGISRKLIKN